MSRETDEQRNGGRNFFWRERDSAVYIDNGIIHFDIIVTAFFLPENPYAQVDNTNTTTNEYGKYIDKDGRNSADIPVRGERRGLDGLVMIEDIWDFIRQ